MKVESVTRTNFHTLSFRLPPCFSAAPPQLRRWCLLPWPVTSLSPITKTEARQFALYEEHLIQIPDNTRRSVSPL